MIKPLSTRILKMSLLLWLSIAVISSCTTPQVHKVKEEQNGSRIMLKVGESMQIALAGNLTTGYAWEIAENNPNLLEEQGRAEYQQEKTNLVGKGGIFLFTFKAIANGTTTLKLVYRRSFEKDMPPIQEYQLTVSIE
jgi:inhibitor of cysteine peptidase